MFSQKRRNYKSWIWAAIALTAVVFCLVLILGYLGRSNDEPYQQTTTKEKVYEPYENDRLDDEYEDFDYDDDEDGDDEGDELQTAADLGKDNHSLLSYYLVKYDNDVIRVYYYDDTGDVTELEETNIVYEILSVDDQKRFEAGVKLENRDSLNKLLMDYES